MKKQIQLLLTFSFLIVYATSAQTGNFSSNWISQIQHTNTNNFSNESRKVIVNPLSGNIYALIDVTSDRDIQGVVTTNNYSYVIVLKYSPTGVLLDNYSVDVGQHTVNGPNYKSGFGLEMDGSGNVYVGYMSYDPVTGYDVNISKLGTNLNFIWNYKFNPSSDDAGVDLKVSSSGTAFALVKSVAPGNIVRERVIKAIGSGTSTNMLYNFNAGDDHLNSLALDPSSNLYITGYRIISGKKAILIASLTQLGGMRWFLLDNCGTNFGDDVGSSIAYSPDGFVYITGSSVGTVQHGIDVVTMKFASSNGKKIWENFINYTLSDGGFKVLVPDANTVFVSWTAGSSVFVDLLSGASGNNVRRATYTPSPVTTSTVDEIKISDMQISATKIVYVTGNVLATNFLNQTFNANYLIKVNFNARGNSRIEADILVEGNAPICRESKSIALDAVNNNVILVYDRVESFTTHQQEMVNIVSLSHSPNFRASNSHSNPTINVFETPGYDILNVRADEAIRKITITSLNGQTIQSLNYSDLETFESKIPTDGIASGMYLVMVEHVNGFVNTSKIIIE